MAEFNMSFKDDAFAMQMDGGADINIKDESRYDEFDMSFQDNTFKMAMDYSDDLDVNIMDNLEIKIEPVNHNDLLNRDAPDVHPISSITGLSEAMEQQDGKLDDLQNQVEQCSSAVSDAVTSINNIVQDVESQARDLSDHITNMEVHINNNEREFWNNKTRAYRNASESLVITSLW